MISIHAPHTGRDLQLLHGVLNRDIISIHAPHTGRDFTVMIAMCPSLRISIHAPHTGRDGVCLGNSVFLPNFNPRAPYGARQQKCIIYVLHFCNNRQSKHKNQQETSSVRTFF